MPAVSQYGRTVEPGYEIRAATTTNRPSLTLSGMLTAEEVRAAADETVATAESLAPEFDVSNDISRLRPPSPAAGAPIIDAQIELVMMGVGSVVRVMHDQTSTVTENAFRRRSRQVGYTGRVAPSVAAAEQLLE